MHGGQPRADPGRRNAAWTPGRAQIRPRDVAVSPAAEEFTAQIRDIYLPPGDIGFWQGALRDPAAAVFKRVGAVIETTQPLMVSVVYGDFAGGQRVISQCALRCEEPDGWCRRVDASSSTGPIPGSPAHRTRAEMIGP